MPKKVTVSENEVLRNIKRTSETYSSLIKNINRKKDSIIHSTLWLIRAELELICVELKYLLNKEEKMEKWQKDFFNSFKGTSSKEKAKKLLKTYTLSSDEIVTTYRKSKEEIYRYLWKLKETISLTLKAFPVESYSLENGKIKKLEKEEIFEI
ncbi:MAG: hypothetical protein ACTSSG_04715 [Candidatus Heimdallarchaeaceae archaeon]